MSDNVNVVKIRERDFDEVEQIRKAKINPLLFRPLYDRHYKSIYIFVLKRVNDRSVAADISSQVFLKVLQALPKYSLKGIPFSAWLYRIAINEINQFFRKVKSDRYVSLDYGTLTFLYDELNYDFTKESLLDKLPHALQNLSETELYIIELRFFEQLSFKEISILLDIKEVGAKVKTYRTLEKLKKILTHDTEN